VLHTTVFLLSCSNVALSAPACSRRYQAAGEKLAVENFCLADELAKQKLTLADINEFLTTELKARSLAAAQASHVSCSSRSSGWTQQYASYDRTCRHHTTKAAARPSTAEK
jgi:hypothetical protein